MKRNIHIILSIRFLINLTQIIKFRSCQMVGLDARVGWSGGWLDRLGIKVTSSQLELELGKTDSLVV